MEKIRNKEEMMREEEVMKLLMELMEQQGMKSQSQDFREVLNYVTSMQMQLQTMTNELQGLKNQIADMQKNQSQSMNVNVYVFGGVDLNKVSNLQKNSTILSERMSSIKEHMMDTAAKTITTFKEKGKEGMSKVFQKGISTVKAMLESSKGQMMNVLADYEKTANQIDNIGTELKQIGTSFANVRRIMAGKEAQEISNDKVGVGLTRAMNVPVKKNIAALQKQISGLDKIINKLDKISAGLNSSKDVKAQKDNQKSCVSMKEKMAEMKEKSDKQQALDKPEVEKSKKKEACL